MSRHDAVPLLPANAVLEYLAEGAANVVYRLSIPQASPPPPPPRHLSDDSLLHGKAHGDQAVGAAKSAPAKPGVGVVVVVAPESRDQDDGGAAAASAAAAAIFKGRLLRLRKALPSTVSNERSYQNFHEIIRPLFPTTDYLVRPELVRVPAGVLAECNARLREAEAAGEHDDADAAPHVNGQQPGSSSSSVNGVTNGDGGGGGGHGGNSNSSSSNRKCHFRRPAKRHGVYLAEDEPYGVLVTDMTADACKGELSLEFKPKWLAQSPSAPAAAKRCRTCALRAKKMNAAAAAAHHRRSRDAAAEAAASFCPLDLVSDDRRRVEMAVRCILAANAAALRGLKEEEEENEVVVEDGQQSPSSSFLSSRQLEGELSRFLYRHPLLRRLRQLQVELDPHGVLALEALPAAAIPAAYANFLIAMTLRDCTVFLKIRPPPPNHDNGVNSRHAPHHHHHRQDQTSTLSSSSSSSLLSSTTSSASSCTNNPPLPASSATTTTSSSSSSSASPSSSSSASTAPLIEICLGDLDLKAPNGGKAGYWRALETELINGGWYTGEEKDESEGGRGGEGGGDGGRGSENGVRDDIHCNISATTRKDGGLRKR